MTRHTSLKKMVGNFSDELAEGAGQPLAPLVEHSSEFATSEFLMNDESSSTMNDNSKSSLVGMARSGLMASGRKLSSSGRLFSSTRQIEPPEAAVREDSKPSLFDNSTGDIQNV